jgi:biopolymer transport protein ExbD
VIALTLIFVYVFVVFIHVCWRYRLARRAPTISRASRKTLVGDLNVEVGSLKSIALTAPYLGLLGTCEGILSAFRGVAMEKHAALAMIATRVSLALITTAVGIPVAVVAACVYNYLHPRIDLVENEIFEEGQQRCRYGRRASRFQLTKRFSGLPAFGVIAAPGLAIVIAGYMTFASFDTSTGFTVELASARCEHPGNDRVIVLRITDRGEFFLNHQQENRNILADRLSEIYSMRKSRTLYVLADSGVPFQTLADVLDTVKNAPVRKGPPIVGVRQDELGIKVHLITPKTFNQNCPKPSRD